MKKIILVLGLAGGVLLSGRAQTDQDQSWPQMEQMQQEMLRFFEQFSQQFDLEEGGMLLDTMIMKPFFFGAPEGGSEMLPEGFSQQLNKMMEQMMKSFGGFPGQDFNSGDMEEWLKELQEQLPPGFELPPPPDKDGIRKKKRKTYTL